RDILEAAQDLSIPLEINGYGFRKPMRETKHGLRLQYPVREFWELASEYDVSVVVSSDAHRPCDVYASLDKCIELAEECGLKFADLDLTPRK
ncbi:MAG: histidinol phosphate phosphatase, partial [Lentisphaeria bacterium]|nr:histidinol phosphate phosphatase [Lentisphaeria bacterium]